MQEQDLIIDEEIDKLNLKITVEKKKGIDCLNAWVAEARAAHGTWHEDAWLNEQFKDGVQWDQSSWDEAVSKDITPVTANRIFSVIESLKGEYISGQQYVQAKGRTQADSEVSQLMTESIAFVFDANEFYDTLPLSFEDMITTGFGVFYVGHQGDPREEKIIIQRRPWYSVMWDPFGDSYFDHNRSRYVFYSDWKNVEDLCSAYPKDAEAIKGFVQETNSSSLSFDVSQIVEDKTNDVVGWVSTDGKRCRPVEMYYAVYGKGLFAIMPDGTAEELEPDKNPTRANMLIQQARQIVESKIKRIRKAVFIGKLLLEDEPSPFEHGKYPYRPFVGYQNRFGLPYGVPTNLRDTNMEINRRRSMALAQLSTKRVIMEENTADDPREVYEEAQRLNPLIIVKDDKLATITVDEMGGLAREQIDMLHESEREIKEISGRNNEQLGYRSGANISRVAFEAKVNQSSEQAAFLFANEKRGRKGVGSLVGDLIQKTDTWTASRVLRVTDRVTAAEKFHVLNEEMVDEETGEVITKNNIAHGKFDYKITDAPVTDTVREKNVELLLAAINRAPQEAVGALVTSAFELSNLPNKDALTEKINMAMGIQPIDHDLTKAEREEAQVQRKADLEEKQAVDAEFERRERELDLQEREAKIASELAAAEASRLKAQTDLLRAEQDGYAKGFEIQQQLNVQRNIHPAPISPRYN